MVSLYALCPPSLAPERHAQPGRAWRGRFNVRVRRERKEKRTAGSSPRLRPSQKLPTPPPSPLPSGLKMPLSLIASFHPKLFLRICGTMRAARWRTRTLYTSDRRVWGGSVCALWPSAERCLSVTLEPAEDRGSLSSCRGSTWYQVNMGTHTSYTLSTVPIVARLIRAWTVLSGTALLLAHPCESQPEPNCRDLSRSAQPSGHTAR